LAETQEVLIYCVKINSYKP